MVCFAHLADVHLGAFRDQRLRELNLQAFEKAMDECQKRGVDFVIIAGDLFDINIPDLSVVERAVRKMRWLGKPVYVVYGSHDYSPTQTSVIDVLHEAGVVHKVSSGVYKNGKLVLGVIKDAKTGVQITGISARKLGLEKRYFQELDSEALEALDGPKIFVFHCAIAEYKPSTLQRMDAVPFSLFPKGFDYYAGGHVHEKLVIKHGEGNLAYPGPLFAADFRDLKELSSHEHGFYVVKLDERTTEFVPVRDCSVWPVSVSVEGLTVEQANLALQKACAEAERADVALLHATGTLKHGKPSELKWGEMREALERKSKIVYVNRSVQPAGQERIRVDASHPEQVAEKIFKESLANSHFSPALKDVKTSLALLNALKQDNPGETKKRWEEIVAEKGRAVLKL